MHKLSRLVKIRNGEKQYDFSGTVYLRDIVMRSKGVTIPINQHPYYKSLVKNDPELFKRYVGDKHKNKNDSWSAYQKLVSSIKNGFNNNLKHRIHVRRCVARDGKEVMRVSNGRHRVTAIFFIYGGDTLVEIENSRVVGIKVKK